MGHCCNAFAMCLNAPPCVILSRYRTTFAQRCPSRHLTATALHWGQWLIQPFFSQPGVQHGPTQCLASVQRQLQRSDEFLCSRTRCLGRCTDHLRSDAGRPTRTGWTCRPNHARFRRSALSNYLRWTSICQSKRKSKDQRHTFLQLKRPTESQSHIG